LALEAKIKDGQSGLQAILDYCENKKKEIDETKDAASKSLTQINENLGTVATRIEEINKAYDDFTAANLKITNPETGLSAILEKTTTTKIEIDLLKTNGSEILTEINQLKEESIKLNAGIDGIKKNASESLSQIEARTAGIFPLPSR